MGLGHERDWDVMGLGHERDWDVMGLGHERTGTSGDWDTKGTGTSKDWDAMGLGRQGSETPWDWETWDTKGQGHEGHPLTHLFNSCHCSLVQIVNQRGNLKCFELQKKKKRGKRIWSVNVFPPEGDHKARPIHLIIYFLNSALQHVDASEPSY